MPQINAPTIDPYYDLAPTQQLPDETGLTWPSFVLHAANVNQFDPLTPYVYGPEQKYNGLWTLGHVARTLQPADEVSPCGNFPGDTCVSYFQGPVKLGPLYGYYSDDPQGGLPHTLKIESLGNCKVELTGQWPYCPGFTNKGSIVSENSFSARVPSETYLFLDGSRVARITLQTWYAALTDSAFTNSFDLLNYYMYAQNYEFWDNPYVAGPDQSSPFYQAGIQWYSFDGQGQISWSRTLQHVGGQSFWQMKWFEENNIDPFGLTAVVKTWYGIQPEDPDNPDYFPDPWSIGIDEKNGATGCRPPDDCLFLQSGETSTVFAGGDEIFNVDPTYAKVPGFTWNTSQDQCNIKWVHIAYYYEGVVVGQNAWTNIQFPTQYFPVLYWQNYVLEQPDPTVELQYLSGTANMNIFPYGALGQDRFPYVTANLLTRNNTTLTWAIVCPTNLNENVVVDFGDGSPTVQIAPLATISHTYSQSGAYVVALTFQGRTSRTVFQTV